MIPAASSSHALRISVPPSSGPARRRRCVATLALLTAVGALAWPSLNTLMGIATGTRSWPEGSDLVLYAFLALPVLCVAASAWLLHLRWLPAQVAVRAVSWALLVVASIGCLAADNARLSWVVVVSAVGAAVSLLALGRLDTGGGAFSPRRHRGALLLGLILALADAGTLLFWGGLASLGFALHGDDGAFVAALFYLPSGLLMLAAVYGVYRLRLWGVVLNVLANVGVAALLVSWNPGDLPFAFRLPLVVTAALQLLLLLPLLRSLAGKTVGGDAWRGWRYLPSVIVLAVLAIDLFAVLALSTPVLHI